MCFTTTEATAPLPSKCSSLPLHSHAKRKWSEVSKSVRRPNGAVYIPSQTKSAVIPVMKSSQPRLGDGPPRHCQDSSLRRCSSGHSPRSSSCDQAHQGLLPWHAAAAPWRSEPSKASCTPVPVAQARRSSTATTTDDCSRISSSWRLPSPKSENSPVADRVGDTDKEFVNKCVRGSLKRFFEAGNFDVESQILKARRPTTKVDIPDLTSANRNSQVSDRVGDTDKEFMNKCVRGSLKRFFKAGSFDVESQILKARRPTTKVDIPDLTSATLDSSATSLTKVQKPEGSNSEVKLEEVASCPKDLCRAPNIRELVQAWLLANGTKPADVTATHGYSSPATRLCKDDGVHDVVASTGRGPTAWEPQSLLISESLVPVAGSQSKEERQNNEEEDDQFNVAELQSEEFIFLPASTATATAGQDCDWEALESETLPRHVELMGDCKSKANEHFSFADRNQDDEWQVCEELLSCADTNGEDFLSELLSCADEDGMDEDMWQVFEESPSPADDVTVSPEMSEARGSGLWGLGSWLLQTWHSLRT